MGEGCTRNNILWNMKPELCKFNSLKFWFKRSVTRKFNQFWLIFRRKTSLRGSLQKYFRPTRYAPCLSFRLENNTWTFHEVGYWSKSKCMATMSFIVENNLSLVFYNNNVLYCWEQLIFYYVQLTGKLRQTWTHIHSSLDNPDFQSAGIS